MGEQTMSDERRPANMQSARAEYAALRYPGDLASDIHSGISTKASTFPWRRIVIGAAAAIAAMIVLGTLTVGVVVYHITHRPGFAWGRGAKEMSLMPTAISLSLPSTGEVSLASAPSWSSMSLSLEGLSSVSGAGVSLPALPRVEAGPGNDESIHRGGEPVSTKERL